MNENVVKDAILFEKGFVDSEGNNRYFVNCPFCRRGIAHPSKKNKKTPTSIWSEIATFDQIKAHMLEWHHFSHIDTDKDGNIYNTSKIFIDENKKIYSSIEECCKARNLPIIKRKLFDERVSKGKDIYTALTTQIQEHSLNHIGETSVARNGQKMTIIAYRGAKDIDIMFEDGTVIEHKMYYTFLVGNIRNPNIPVSSYNPQAKPEKHIGETSIARNGQKMTITGYRNNRDIDVMFEDGTIIEHTQYSSFLKGYIKNPNFNKKVPA